MCLCVSVNSYTRNFTIEILIPKWTLFQQSGISPKAFHPPGESPGSPGKQKAAQNPCSLLRKPSLPISFNLEAFPVQPPPPATRSQPPPPRTLLEVPNQPGGGSRGACSGVPLGPARVPGGGTLHPRTPGLARSQVPAAVQTGPGVPNFPCGRLGRRSPARAAPLPWRSSSLRPRRGTPLISREPGARAQVGHGHLPAAACAASLTPARSPRSG